MEPLSCVRESKCVSETDTLTVARSVAGSCARSRLLDAEPLSLAQTPPGTQQCRKHGSLRPKLAAFLFALAPLAVLTQQPVAPDAGCALAKSAYTCNWSSFKLVFDRAHTVAVLTGPPNHATGRATARQVQALLAELGKVPAPEGQPADLTLLLEPVDPLAFISAQPTTRLGRNPPWPGRPSLASPSPRPPHSIPGPLQVSPLTHPTYPSLLSALTRCVGRLGMVILCTAIDQFLFSY